MESKIDVVIASAFGRGNWLASELSDKGLSVALVDVSEKLGRWTPEDWEGPFGFFQSEKLQASQVTRLIHEDYQDPVDDGFVVWGEEGPIDCKGPLSSYWLSGSSLMSNLKEHLTRFENFKSSSDRYQWTEEVLRRDYKDTWLVHLSHQLASNVFMPNAEGALYGDPLPLFSSYYVRRSSRRGAQKALESCVDKGVKVFSSSNISDVLIDGRNWKGIEVQGEWSGALLGKQMLWMLSSQETSKLSEKVCTGLFPRGILEPEWVWMRFRLRMDLGDYRNTVPQKFVMVPKPGLSWTHENLIMVQRTVKEEDFDFWMRIPAHFRFNRQYLEELSLKLLHLIQEKIPFTGAQILDMPQDYLYEYKDLGPSLFPVFNLEQLQDFMPTRLRNLHYGGPETGHRMDWTGRYQWQQKILTDIMTWRQKELSRQKEARHDREIHPS